MIALRLEGDKEVLQYLKDCEEYISAEEYLNEACEYAISWAQHYCPEDTGALYDSIYCRTLPHSIMLGASIRYAIFNELGWGPTPHGAAKYKGQRPFLEPAILKTVERFPAIFSRGFPK